MGSLVISLLLAVLMDLHGLPMPRAHAAATLELYGTFHAMGVVVALDAGDDPDLDATTTVEYRVDGSRAYRQGFPLSRVSDTRFAGSLFWLEPGTGYEVRITFDDPDGGPLDGLTIEGTAATRAEIAVPEPAPATTHYVSPDGSGTTCSYAEPCSLIEGLSQAQAGEQVILRGGVYYQGELDLPRSGMAGAPVVVRGNPGETAILDGGDPATFTWTAQGGGVYYASVNAPDPHLVMADGQRLLPYQSLSDLQNLVWDTPGFYAEGTDLYVRLAGDVDPNGAAMVVTRYNYAFYVEQNYIYFLNLTFRHYGQGSYAKAIYFNNASDNLVQGCTFAVNDLGIGLKRDSHRNVIQDNDVLRHRSLTGRGTRSRPAASCRTAASVSTARSPGGAISSAATPSTTILTVLAPVPTTAGSEPTRPTCTRTWSTTPATMAWRPTARAATCASGATPSTTC